MSEVKFSRYKSISLHKKGKRKLYLQHQICCTQFITACSKHCQYFAMQKIGGKKFGTIMKWLSKKRKILLQILYRYKSVPPRNYLISIIQNGAKFLQSFSNKQLYFEACVIIPTITLVVWYSIEKCHFIYLFVCQNPNE